jgi:hypothetical protein
MDRLAPWARCLVVVASLYALRPASAAVPEPLLGYCVKPFMPPCVDALKDHPDQLPACERQMDVYVATVFRYRTCLTRETERAVRETNAAIAKLRCAQKRGSC